MFDGTCDNRIHRKDGNPSTDSNSANQGMHRSMNGRCIHLEAKVPKASEFTPGRGLGVHTDTEHKSVVSPVKLLKKHPSCFCHITP